MPADSVNQSTERTVLTTIVWITCVAFLCGLTVADPDLWGHTLYGLRSIEQGLLTELHDPFSYTAAGHEWVNHEWLTEFQFGWLWSQFGNGGLVLWRNIWCLIAMTTALIAMRQQRASLAACLLLLVFMSEALADFMVFVRPQMATFGMFAVSLFLLRRFYSNPDIRWLLPLPCLMALWVNHHGGFLAGLGLQVVTVVALAVESFRNTARRTALRLAAAIFVASVMATFINPFGPNLHLMLWDHLITPQSVREWQPLWRTQQSPVYYIPFLLTAIALLKPRRWNLLDVLLMAVVCWQAVSHIRHVALLCLANLIILPAYLSENLRQLFPHLSQQWSTDSRRRLRFTLTACIVVFLGALQIRGSWAMWQRGIGPWSIAVESTCDVPGMPVRAMSFIKSQKLSGNLLTDYGWGQFVIWHLYPDVRVGFDGRYRTVYPAELEQQFLEFQTVHKDQPQHSDMLDSFPTDLVLLPNGRGPCRYLASRRDWHLIYRDDQASLFAREQAVHQSLITEFADTPSPDTSPTVWSEFPGSSSPLLTDTKKPQSLISLAQTAR